MHTSSSSPRNLDVGWAKDLAMTLFLGEDKVHEYVARKKAATQRVKDTRRKWRPRTSVLFRFGDRFTKENHTDLSVTAVNAASDEAEAKTASRASGAAASTDQISRRSESIIESLTYEFRPCNEG